MIRQKLTYGSTFCAVEYANNSTYNLLSLKKKKKELDIVKKEQHSSFQELTTSLKGQKHLFLVVNNEQVISKKVEFTHIAKESVVKNAFPNITLSDFYFEVYDNGASSMVSICRKEAIQKIIQQFQENGVYVIHFSLGNNSIQKIVPFLNDFSFHTSNSVFEVNDHKIIEWKKSKEVAKTYDINGLVIESNQLLPLAGVLSYYQKLDNSPEEELQNKLEKEFWYKRVFHLGVQFGLGILLVLLLINFITFSSYRNTVSNLEAEVSLNEIYRKQLLTLNESVTKKKKLVESMNSVSNSKVIWYVNEISKTVPTTISLNELNYQPLERPARDKKPIVFKSNQIIVKGMSKDNIDFSNWIAQLEKFDWIKKISHEDFGSKDSKDTPFDFSIELNNPQP